MGKSGGHCPQKQVIEYPELGGRPYRKFHAVDFIPKKKNENEIMTEIEKERKKPLVYLGRRGQNREQMIEELQEIHRFGDKKLMDAQLERERQRRLDAKIAMANAPVDNKARLRAKYNNMGLAQNAMKHYEEKYGVNPSQYLLSQPKSAKEARTKQDEELQDLFD